MNRRRIENNEQPRKDNDSVASDKSDYLKIIDEKHNKSYFSFFDRKKKLFSRVRYIRYVLGLAVLSSLKYCLC